MTVSNDKFLAMIDSRRKQKNLAKELVSYRNNRDFHNPRFSSNDVLPHELPLDHPNYRPYGFNHLIGGQKAETFFENLIKSNDLKVEFKNCWYDFLVEDFKVEVKSCQLTIKNNDKKALYRRRIGRFDFTNHDNKKKQIEEDIWVCLIIRHIDECLLYGFVKASKILNKRYLSIHQARELKPLCLIDWIAKIKFLKESVGYEETN